MQVASTSSSPESGDAGQTAFQWPLEFMRRERFNKGEYIFKAGDHAEKLYYIASGSIRLPELGLLLTRGQVIGEMGLFSPNRSRSASALAVEDVEAYTMGSEEVRQLMSRDPALATTLIEVVLRRMMDQVRAEVQARERIDAELRIARNIQASMLPRVFPPFPGRHDFEIYAMMEPANEVGGDFYDFFLIHENKLCVLVGDVSGKGVPAALLMALSKTLLRSEAMRGYGASEILARVNQALCKDNADCMFLTALCLILNTRTGEAECCSAGHHPLLVWSADGSLSSFDAGQGLLVGFDEGFHFQSRTLSLEPGTTVLLYTDGVTEAENSKQEPFSEERLRACISSACSSGLHEVIAAVKQEVTRHCQGQPQSDDITMLALRYNGVPQRN